jgi:ABC-2 type transport system permease protein
MFFGPLFLMGRADMRSFFAPSPFSPAMLLVVLAPALTMRLVAEERKSGSIELLTTMPVRDSEVILGKYLGAFGVLALALAPTMFYAVTVAALGALDFGPVLSGYVGMLLLAGALIAIGLMVSTWTENQIVAFIVAFLISAALFFIYWLQFFVPEGLAPLFEFISVSYHLDNMARGVIDTRDVVYYIALAAGSLTIATHSLGEQHA